MDETVAWKRGHQVVPLTLNPNTFQAVVMFWLDVTFSSLAPECLKALPTLCHGATYISLWSVLFYTQIWCVPCFLYCHTTCTEGSPSFPTSAIWLGSVGCRILLRAERKYEKAPAATVNSTWSGRFHLVQAPWVASLMNFALPLPFSFFLKVSDFVLDHGPLFPNSRLWPLLEMWCS